MRAGHEALLIALSEQDFQLWRHHPITSAYLLYLGDQVEAFRTAAADLVEAGNLSNADLICGQIKTLRELQSLSLSDIHSFYRQEEGAGNDGGNANETGPGTSR